MADEDVGGGLDAGGVYLDLGARFKRHGFDEWERRRNRADFEAKRKIEQELGAKLDDRGFKRYYAEVDKSKRKARELAAFKAVLGADFDERAFNAYNRESDKATKNTLRLRGATKDLDFGLVQLGSRIPLVKWGLIITGATAATEALISFTAAAGPAIGVLGALPGAVAAAGQGLGTLVLGFAGVGDAVKESAQAQDQASRSTAQSADRTVQALRAVQDAEENVKEAHEQTQLAVEALTRTREEARREITDNAKATGLALRQATEELHRLQGDPEATRLQLDQAEEQVRLAQRAREDAKKASSEGVEGDQRVKDAKRAVKDSIDAERDAQQQLTDAIKEQTRATTELSSANQQLQDSMRHLSPAAREFVNFIVGLRPELDQLRATAATEMFPGLQLGIQRALRNLPVLRRIVKDTAAEVGTLGADAGQMIGGREWGRDLQDQGARNADTLDDVGHAALFLADALRHVMRAADPLQAYLSESTKQWAENRAQQAEAARESGRLEAYFRRTITVLRLLGDIGENVAKTFLNIGKAANEAEGGGNQLLVTLRELTKRSREWTASAEGQAEMREIFEDIRRATKAVFDEIGDLIRRYRELRREGKDVGDALAITLGEAFGDATEIFVKQMAERAPDVASAFIQGFLASNAWGKLAITGWLIAKLGGVGAITGVGKSIAGNIVSGMNSGLGGFLSKFATVRGSSPANPVFVEDATGGGGGPGGLLTKGGAGATALRTALMASVPILGGVGIAVAAHILKDKTGIGLPTDRDRPTTSAEARAEGGRRGEREFFERRGRTPSGHAPTGPVGDMRGGETGITEGTHDENIAAGGVRAGRIAQQARRAIRQLRIDGSKDVKDLNDVVDDNLKRIRKNFGTNTAEARSLVRENFGEAAKAVAKAMKDGRLSVEDGMEAIERLMKTHSKAGRIGMAQELDETANKVRNTMKRAGNVTKEGLAIVKELMIKELRLYGLSERQAIASANVRTGEVAGGFRRQDQQLGGVLNAWKGAVVPGRGTGDTVPVHVGGRLAAMVEPGELISVLNRRATQFMMAVNRRIPRMGGVAMRALGGMVRVPGDPNDTGGRDRVSAGIAPKVGQWVRRYRANVGYGYDPGGGHVSPGHNVTGTATDVYPGPGGSWDLLERGLRVLVNAGLKVLYGSNGIGIAYPNHGRGNHAHIEWAGADNIPGLRAPRIRRVVVQGRDSPLKAYVQESIDKGRRAATRQMRRVINRSLTGDPHSMGGGQFDLHELMQLWIRAGGDPNVARVAAAVALAESGGNPRAQGPVTSYGFRAAGLWQIHPPQPGSFNPLQNARQAVAKYEGAGGWSPWEAYTNGNYRDFLQRGGVLRLRNGGTIDVEDATGGKDFLQLPSRLQVNDRVSGVEEVGGGTLKEVVSNLERRLGPIKSANTRAQTWLSRFSETYSRRERFFDMSDELIVLSPGDPGFDKGKAKQKTGFEDGSYIDETALLKREKELGILKRMQEERQERYDRWVQGIVRIVRLYRGAKKRLADLITKKMPKKRRAKYRSQIEAFDRAIRGWKGQVRDARGERADAWLDLKDVRQELSGLRPGAERDVAGANEALGGETDEQSAITEQAKRRAEVAQAELRSVRAALEAFAGPGDIGRGGPTALDAVLRPTGRVGPGFSVGPGGQLIPAGGGGIRATPWGEPAGPYHISFVFPSSVPYTRDQAKEVGSMAVSGIEQQAPRISPRNMVAL